MAQHASLAAPLAKELHYFVLNHHRCYRAHFPRLDELPPGGQTFEASPYYLFHPAVPARVKALLPDSRLIVMLREPVERAYSHYWHEHRRHLCLPARDCAGMRQNAPIEELGPARLVASENA